MDDPTPLGQYLGCNHKQSTFTLPNGVQARAVEYDMEDFLDSCVSRYIDLATQIQGTEPKIRTVATPFLEDTSGGSLAGSPCAPTGTPSVCCPWCNNHFPIEGHQKDPIEALRAKERERQKRIKDAKTPNPQGGVAGAGGARSVDVEGGVHSSDDPFEESRVDGAGEVRVGRAVGERGAHLGGRVHRGHALALCEDPLRVDGQFYGPVRRDDIRQLPPRPQYCLSLIHI